VGYPLVTIKCSQRLSVCTLPSTQTFFFLRGRPHWSRSAVINNNKKERKKLLQSFLTALQFELIYLDTACTVVPSGAHYFMQYLHQKDIRSESSDNFSHYRHKITALPPVMHKLGTKRRYLSSIKMLVILSSLLRLTFPVLLKRRATTLREHHHESDNRFKRYHFYPLRIPGKF